MTRGSGKYVWMLAAMLTLMARVAGVHAETTEGPALSSEIERARTLFRQGVKAGQEGRVQDSLNFFRQAWQLRRTYDIAANLAQVEIKLGLHRDAAEHLHYSLKNYSPTASKNEFENLRAQLESEKAHVGTVTVQVDRDGAMFYVDGQPAADSTIFVEPGSRTIEARLGDERASQVVQVEAGNEYEIKLALSAAPDASLPDSEIVHESPNPVLPPEEPRDSSRSLVPVYVGAGIVVASAGLVVASILGKNSAADDVDRLTAALGDDGCTPGGPVLAECDELSDALDRHDGHRNRLRIGIVVGSGAAIATAAYLFWPTLTGTSATRTGWRATADLSATHGLLVFGRNF